MMKFRKHTSTRLRKGPTYGVTASVIICEKFSQMRLFRALYLRNLLNYEIFKMKLKKPFLRKWLFKILVIFFPIWNCLLQQIFVLKQCVFVQEGNVLSNSSKCHIKIQPFFYQNHWKTENRIFWLFSKSGYISLSRIGEVGPFLRHV